MPWCPKCKSEYRDGFTVCVDCGCELVDEETFAKMEAEKAAGQRGLPPGAADMPGVSDMTNIADGSDLNDMSGRPDLDSPQISMKTRYGSIYQNSSERASENRYSAWILLVLGSLGLIVLALGIIGVIPLRFGNSYLFYGVMSAVFILFIVSGIVSMKNALVFDKKAESENSIRDTMKAWCVENLKRSDIDAQAGISDDVPEEIQYFRRFEYIKERLNYQFVNLDQDFLDKFIDDCVYDMVFQENEDNSHNVE